MNRQARTGNSTLQSTLERVFRRLKQRAGSAARDAAMLALVAPGVPAMVGCQSGDTPVSSATTPAAQIATAEAALDWVHNEGVKNTDMVSYMGAFWTQSTGCGPRGGCTGLDVVLKIRVKQQSGADLGTKKVGAYCEAPLCAAEGTTAVGSYHGALGDGWEEWHVPVAKAPWDVGAFTFTAWYQDGKGNTFFDDNEGELHVAPYKGTPIVLRHDWLGTTLEITDGGVSGKVSMMLASLDFDKELQMAYTTDGWVTSGDLGIGTADEKNAWHWKESLGNGYERWEIEVDLPGAVDRFEYAVVYRHGIKGGAKVYEFWDNNGTLNYVIQKGQKHAPQP